MRSWAKGNDACVYQFAVTDTKPPFHVAVRQLQTRWCDVFATAAAAEIDFVKNLLQKTHARRV